MLVLVINEMLGIYADGYQRYPYLTGSFL